MNSPLSVPPIRPQYVATWLGMSVFLTAVHIVADSMLGRTDVSIGPWTTLVSHTLSNVLFAAALVGVTILIRVDRGQVGTRWQPGHWLLINLCVTGLMSFAYSFVLRSEGLKTIGIMLVAAACSLFSAGLFWLAHRRQEAADPWKGVFTVFAVTHLLVATVDLCMALPKNELVGAISMLLLLPTLFCGILALIYFVAAILRDYRGRVGRDWLHWVGVIIVAISPLTNLFWMLGRRFALP